MAQKSSSGSGWSMPRPSAHFAAAVYQKLQGYAVEELTKLVLASVRVDVCKCGGLQVLYSIIIRRGGV